MTKRLFHLILAADLGAARKAPDDGWQPSSLEREGFVHLSFADQLPGTLQVHYAQAGALLLAEVDAASVAEALRVETSRANEAFPHVYRALGWNEFVRWWRLTRSADGRWCVPELCAAPADDTPAGSESAPV